MNKNMLKLNDDNPELIVFTSKYKQDLYNDLSITIGDTVVDCSSQVKYLRSATSACVLYLKDVPISP